MRGFIRNRYRESFFCVVVAMVAFLLIQNLLGLVYEWMLINLGGDLPVKALYFVGTMLITLVIAFPVFCILMGTNMREVSKFFHTHYIRRSGGITLQYLILSIAVACIVIGIELYFVAQQTLDPAALAPGTLQDILFTFLQSVLLFPIMEEIMFRGITLHHLESYGVGGAVVLSTIVFAVGHLHPVNSLIALPTGCIFAFAVLKTGNLGTSILCHMVTNALANLALPLLLATRQRWCFYVVCVFVAVMLILGLVVFLKQKNELFTVAEEL